MFEQVFTGLSAMAAHDGARDGQPRPVEVTVIAQLTAAADDNVSELVKRRRRPSFGAQQGRRARAQLGGGAAEHGRILADVDDRAADRRAIERARSLAALRCPC